MMFHRRRRRRSRRSLSWPDRLSWPDQTARYLAPSSTIRWVSACAAVVFAAFAAYGSWVPLDLQSVSFDEAVERFGRTRLIPFYRASRTDLVTNVLLALPIGFFLTGAFAARSWRAVARWIVPVVALCAGLGVAIEFGQIFVSGRTPSWNDVIAQALGAVIGALGWLVIGPRVVDSLVRMNRADAQRADVLWRLLGAYTAVWVMLGVLPLDFTLRAPELAQKYRTGRIVLLPFSGAATLSDYAGVLMMALPIGAFMLLLGMRRKSEWPIAFAVILGGALTSLVELAQLLALSRTADVTDVLMNLVGVAAGAVGVSKLLQRDVLADGRTFRSWPLAALAAWCLVLVVRHWSPFDFTISSEYFRARLPVMFRVPFHSYYWGMPLNSLAEAVTKVLLGIPVGALLSLAWTPSARAVALVRAAAVVAGTAAIFLVIELGQLLEPTRVPDQTDVYLGLAGALVGLWSVRVLSRHPGVPADGQSVVDTAGASDRSGAPTA